MQVLRTVEDSKSQKEDEISKNNETEHPKCQKRPQIRDRRLNQGVVLKKKLLHTNVEHTLTKHALNIV